MKERDDSGDGSCDDPLKESRSTLLGRRSEYCMPNNQQSLPKARNQRDSL
jgi:hypothetical protein